MLDKLIDYYAKKDGLLLKRLELIKNKHNILIFILLNKILNI